MLLKGVKTLEQLKKLDDDKIQNRSYPLHICTDGFTQK